jgi:hypothetical protein
MPWELMVINSFFGLDTTLSGVKGAEILDIALQTAQIDTIYSGMCFSQHKILYSFATGKNSHIFPSFF